MPSTLVELQRVYQVIGAIGLVKMNFQAVMPAREPTETQFLAECVLMQKNSR